MTHSASGNERTQHIHLDETHTVSTLTDEFLSKLVAELDNETVTAIILYGSYARGNAAPYSDVDLDRFVKEPPERIQQKRFTYRDGLLVSIATRTISQERGAFTIPNRAIFVVPSIREARILLDKEGAFSELQQEARAWTWESLQVQADYYASNMLMLRTGQVHQILRALLLRDELALSKRTLKLFMALTSAVAVQRGMLVSSGNTYFQQVQDLVGLNSFWTHYHKFIAGIDVNTVQGTYNEARGVATLRLYQETVRLLQPILQPVHRDIIEQAVLVIDNALSAFP
jgi:predicted nucleotidyltransferase